MVPELDRVGVLTVIDRAALVAYCEAWATYCDAMEAVRAHGSVVPGRNDTIVKNPAFQVARDCVDTMVKLGARFGWTPSDRARLSIPDADDNSDGENASVLRLLT
jgi:P27 family predicted phage terminase small subunit